MGLAVKYNVNKHCTLEFAAKDMKNAFEFMSYAGELFGVTACGNCESPNLRPTHRQPKGFNYYSLRCADCKHELKFGQQQESGRLFPKGWTPPYQGENAGGSTKPKRGRRREEEYSDEYSQDDEYETAGVAADEIAF